MGLVIDCLRHIEGLRDLPPDGLDFAAERLRSLKFRTDAEVLSHMESSRDIYFIISGRVRINMVAASGRQVTYDILEPGSMFGELAAIDRQPRSTGVYAEEPCLLAKMGDDTFLELLNKHSSFAIAVIRRLTALSRALAAKVFEYHAYDVKGRIYAQLLRERKNLGEATPIPLTAKDMASRVGTTRENASRVFKNLISDNVISRTRGGIVIIDAKRLEELLEECEFG